MLSKGGSCEGNSLPSCYCRSHLQSTRPITLHVHRLRGCISRATDPCGIVAIPMCHSTVPESNSISSVRNLSIERTTLETITPFRQNLYTFGFSPHLYCHNRKWTFEQHCWPRGAGWSRLVVSISVLKFWPLDCKLRVCNFIPLGVRVKIWQV